MIPHVLAVEIEAHEAVEREVPLAHARVGVAVSSVSRVSK
jgi:hypothetical protein